MSHATNATERSSRGALIAAVALVAATLAFCQTGQAQQTETLRTAAELDELVGPIALYPDDLVAIVLPASTYPVQVVQAARLLEDRKSDPTLEPDPSWDSSVVALLNYPEALQMMNDDLDWTWALGEAVLDQQEDVLAAVQRFRNEAYAAGNLESDGRQVVTVEDGDTIEIAPADPEVVYIPYYEPSRVIVRQRAPVFFYYDTGYPLYYYPYPVGYVFPTGYFWGVASWFSIGWHTHYVHVYDYTYYRHPYYRRTYYRPYYRHGRVDTIVNVHVNVDRSNHAWRPTYRRGARPYTTGTRYRADPSRERFATERRSIRTREGIAPARSLSSRNSNSNVRNRYRTDARIGGVTVPRSRDATPRSRDATPRSRLAPNTVERNRSENRTVRPTAPRAPRDVNRTQRSSSANTRSSFRSGGGMSRASTRSRGTVSRAGSNRGTVSRAGSNRGGANASRSNRSGSTGRGSSRSALHGDARAAGRARR